VFVRLAAIAVAAALVAAGAALAKEIEPGQLRVCNNAKCPAIFDGGALKAFSAFYWGNGPVERAPAPSPRAPAFALKLDGWIIGVAATRRLDRVLVYGIYCGRFKRGVWYRLPNRAAMGLRRLTAGLVPQRVPRRIRASC
jgi:hypothetical protein